MPTMFDISTRLPMGKVVTSQNLQSWHLDFCQAKYWLVSCLDALLGVVHLDEDT